MTKRDETVFEYDAFISYRHIPRDIRIAQSLHKALEMYRTPKTLVKRGYPERLKKVFRDKDELPTSSDLGTDIEQALKSSKYLIVLCSPQALKTQWVMREVDFFGEYHGYDRILTLLVDGEPKDAFPQSLIQYHYDDKGNIAKVIEPLAADIRPFEKKSALALLKHEKLRLIAGILGCKYDELRQREQERRIRRIITLVACVAVFFMAVTAFTFWQISMVNAARDLAVKSERLAQEEKNKALGNQSILYASLAQSAADNKDYLLGMSLAMAGLPKNMDNPERPIMQKSIDALTYTTLQYGIQHRTFLYPSEATKDDLARWSFCNASTGDIMTVGSRTVRQFSPITGRLLNEWIAPEGYLVVAVSPNADRVIMASFNVESGLDLQMRGTKTNALFFQQSYDTGNKEKALYELESDGWESLVKAGFEPNSGLFYIAWNEFQSKSRVSHVCLYNYSTGDSSSIRSLSFQGSYYFDALLKNDKLFVSIYEGESNRSRLYAYDITQNDPIWEGSVDGFPYNSVQEHTRLSGITSDGKLLSYVDISDSLHIVNLDSGDEQEILTPMCYISGNGDLAAYFVEDDSLTEFVVYDIVQDRTILESSHSFKKDPKAGYGYCSFTFCANDRFIMFDSDELLDIDDTYLYYLPITKWLFTDMDINGKYIMYFDPYGIGTVVQFHDPKVYESVIPGVNKVSIRDSGVLLFENPKEGETVVRRWDAAEKTVSLISYTERNIANIINLTDGNIGVLGNSNDIAVYDMDSGEIVKNYQTEFDLNDIEVDSADRYMLASGENGVFLLDARTGKQIQRLSSCDSKHGQGDERYMGFSADGNYCWIGEYYFPETDMTGIVIYDLESRKAIKHIPCRAQFGSFSALLSSDGTRMVIEPANIQQLWRLDANMNPSYICDLKGDYFLCMNNRLAVAVEMMNYSSTLYIYDVTTGRQKTTIRLPESHGRYKGMLVNDSKALLTITNAISEFGNIQLNLWDCSTGKSIAKLYSDYSESAEVLGFGLINGGSEIVIVSLHNGKTYIRAIPFITSFDQILNEAEERLGGRSLDVEQDISLVE